MYKRLYIGMAMLLFDAVCSWSQSIHSNLVPNPGFESLQRMPQGWYYQGSDFTATVTEWFSPTGASPDLFGINIHMPLKWQSRGFGELYAAKGRNYAGITLFGCSNGKPHCREYLSVKLKEKLVPGQNYELSFYLAQLPSSLSINNIGIAFSEQPLNEVEPMLLELKPAALLTEVQYIEKNTWKRVIFPFTAETESPYLIIGNFFSDEFTQVVMTEDDKLNFAYYYFDDLDLHKVEPIVVPDTTALIPPPIEKGRTYQLDHIYFSWDKSELLPASYPQLFKLLKVMRENPGFQIFIQGHTDISGNQEYNRMLSNSRARSVADYLRRHGVAQDRIVFQGFGSDQPVASNQTEAGRKLNRRVEFILTE